MNKPVEYDFFSAWKIDDKEWMKERRAAWKDIQIQLERLKLSEWWGLFDRLPKKNYKFLKSYYLTGRDKPETLDEELINCLKGYDGGYDADVLLQFLLSADHSEAYLRFLRQYLEGEFDKREKHYSKEGWEEQKLKRSYEYEKSCQAYRRTIKCYKGSEKYKWDGETTAFNGPIFGELEPNMLKLFPYTPRQVKDLDSGLSSFYKDGFDIVLSGFFGNPLLNDYDIPIACFNPHNPIQYMLEEYERWGILALKERYHEKLNFLSSTSLAWHVADTVEGRHPVQVDVAKEVKQRITDVKKNASKEIKALIEEAIKLYETGEFKQFLK